MPTPTTRDRGAVPAECAPVLLEQDALLRLRALVSLWRKNATLDRASLSGGRAIRSRATTYDRCADELDALLAEVGR